MKPLELKTYGLEVEPHLSPPMRRTVTLVDEHRKIVVYIGIGGHSTIEVDEQQLRRYAAQIANIVNERNDLLAAVDEHLDAIKDSPHVADPDEQELWIVRCRMKDEMARLESLIERTNHLHEGT
jgi:predicted transcriptional regulator